MAFILALHSPFLSLIFFLSVTPWCACVVLCVLCKSYGSRCLTVVKKSTTLFSVSSVVVLCIAVWHIVIISIILNNLKVFQNLSTNVKKYLKIGGGGRFFLHFGWSNKAK